MKKTGRIVGINFENYVIRLEHSDEPGAISESLAAPSLIFQAYGIVFGEPIGEAMEKRGIEPSLRNFQDFLKNEPGLEEKLVEGLKGYQFAFHANTAGFDKLPDPLDTVYAVFQPFFYLLMGEEYGVDVSMHQVLDFYRGMRMGLVHDTESLFTFSRLVFIKKLSQMDGFERAFAKYFLGMDIPACSTDRINTMRLMEWVDRMAELGLLPKDAYINMPSDKLIKMFWERVSQQLEEHHGGSYWIGTGGTSPFGHSGSSIRGVRVGGESLHRSAIQVIGEKRYVQYSEDSTLSGENIRQALESLRHLTPDGPRTLLNVDKTIEETARIGDLELVFDRELRDRLKVILLLDNGGNSMSRYADLTQLLFRKMHSQFKRITPYFFHNCIYDEVYTDSERTRPHSLEKILQEDPETRVFIVSDACMAHEELYKVHGAIDGRYNILPGIDYLKMIAKHFRYSVWLNPMSEYMWDFTWDDEGGKGTGPGIGRIFHMEEMTLNGIRQAVEYLVSLTK